MSSEIVKGTPHQSSEEPKTNKDIQDIVDICIQPKPLPEDVKARCDLVNWIYAITERYKLDKIIALDAIILFDNVLNKLTISRDLIMMCSFIVVSENKITLTPIQLFQICHNRFTSNEIKSVCNSIKKYFSCLHQSGNPIDFCVSYCSLFVQYNNSSIFVGDCVKRNAELMIILITFLPRFSMFDFKLLASSCVYFFLKEFIPIFQFNPCLIFGETFTEQRIQSSINSYRMDLKENLNLFRRFQYFDRTYREVQTYLKLI
ncbi:hypothetical protein EDI_338120 [Entamoeba dispar SAW760]|uniref:Cyclin N-terminal domain-containing protein n=1 Tax=Entamoeba dispar (strain ATCC PRA-260 / SAW760) TaxID=370354 RepID=B0EA72_ENTDS|nr:uncharacterized protein EDI_338120 [Entamoeba dispar SAW760]EDR28559.1 hypothetical protein EDI_338120 [Entamoeba dispar SAW760]|eukprot:EDR28559.1 hypothetical protein EDI_338120 [Entamoeba dispar SAW760]